MVERSIAGQRVGSDEGRQAIRQGHGGFKMGAGWNVWMNDVAGLNGLTVEMLRDGRGPAELPDPGPSKRPRLATARMKQLHQVVAFCPPPLLVLTNPCNGTKHFSTCAFPLENGRWCDASQWTEVRL